MQWTMQYSATEKANESKVVEFLKPVSGSDSK